MDVESFSSDFGFFPRDLPTSLVVHLKVENEQSLHLQLIHQRKLLREVGFSSLE